MSEALERAKTIGVATTFHLDERSGSPILVRRLELYPAEHRCQWWDETTGWLFDDETYGSGPGAVVIAECEITPEEAEVVISGQDGNAHLLYALWDYVPLSVERRLDAAVEAANERRRRQTHQFRCAACGREAATIRAVSDPADFPPGPGRRLIEKTHNRWSVVVSRGGRPQVAISGDWEEDPTPVVRSGDLKAIRRIDRELASFACLECWQPFCGEHLRIFPVMEGGGSPYIDYWEGRCADGHTFTTYL